MRAPIRDRALLTEREVRNFWAKVVVDCACDCWIWVGARTNGDRGEKRAGYGRVKLGQLGYSAHRVAFVTWRGQIPPGKELDHVVCEQRACVNPWHTEPATALANTMRSRATSAVNARKTACLRGHPLSDAWVYLRGYYTSGRPQPLDTAPG